MLLREDFELIELQNLNTEPTPVGETSSDGMVVWGDRSFDLIDYCSDCRAESEKIRRIVYGDISFSVYRTLVPKRLATRGVRSLL